VLEKGIRCRTAHPDEASSSEVETEFGLLISSLGSEISDFKKLENENYFK
jgi:hypothetical protein